MHGRFTAMLALSVREGGVVAQVGTFAGEPDFPLSLDMLSLLEAMTHEHDPAAAREVFLECRTAPPPAEVTAALDEIEQGTRAYSLFTQNGTLLVLDDADRVPMTDLTELSRRTGRVLRAIGLRRGLASGSDWPDVDALFAELYRRGFLVPEPGGLDWGQLRRLVPVCPAFGISRGTPIDRHYLNEFLVEIREEVHGEVVEIGGKDANRDAYGFAKAISYRGMDLEPGPGVSLAADAADPDALPAASLDAVIAFNVLEHTPRPWEVVANMLRWLRPGGTAYCMVPSAQRLHGAPEDYWRPLPAALGHMFGDWTERRVIQYGNPLSAIASLMGIAAQELDPDELAVRHPHYPVASCVIARK
ncbi:class I SAM-dependent methyltransferase [Streptosporangium sp. NPDC002721]|uniref:class I SAM-dependent methyltransferase n=1 Tax=Streptosporangium sp. NPDC002721 TaxID=3366188 RepID=UPI0036C65687